MEILDHLGGLTSLIMSLSVFIPSTVTAILQLWTVLRQERNSKKLTAVHDAVTEQAEEIKTAIKNGHS